MKVLLHLGKNPLPLLSRYYIWLEMTVQSLIIQLFINRIATIFTISLNYPYDHFQQFVLKYILPTDM